MSDDGYCSDSSVESVELPDYHCIEVKLYKLRLDNEVVKSCRHCANLYPEVGVVCVRNHYTVFHLNNNLPICFNCQDPLFKINRGQNCDECSIFIEEFYNAE
jgi:hypothetical protein